MFFKFNSALGPPYHILLDTNFINFSIQNKLDIMQSAMTCLLAKCHIYITDCVMAELEKLGQQYRVALRYFHFILTTIAFGDYSSHIFYFADSIVCVSVLPRIRVLSDWFARTRVHMPMIVSSIASLKYLPFSLRVLAL
jgi:hypothetical protein